MTLQVKQCYPNFEATEYFDETVRDIPVGCQNFRDGVYAAIARFVRD